MAKHKFIPEWYSQTLGNRPHVLRVAAGDTVLTTCADARGTDASGQQVAPSGNPLTGPFHVDTAEPGDTLAIKIEHIAPSGRRGWTGWLLASNVVDPGDVGRLAQADTSNVAWNWDIDTATNVVRLDHPGSRWHGRAFALEPMLGCLGVAPARGQAISTLTSGTHGGNMDYRGYRAGVTAYFPVFEPGGMFSLGDGHVAQGDGEIIGTGIEVSVDVEFSVGVIKRQQIRWPRGEDENFIFTVGNARPLDQCVQHATSEMLRWLMEGYGLDVQHASLLMGLGVRYEVGNVLNPAYTMVCKLPKKLLPVPKS